MNFLMPRARLFVIAVTLLVPLSACAGSPVKSSAAAPASAARAEPNPIKNKTTEFSVRTDVHVCSGETAEVCAIDTFVVAKSLDNAELKWERRIYTLTYDPKKNVETQIIDVKSFSFAGKKMIRAKNARGDVFEIETEHGHLKNPKDVRKY